MKFSVMPAALKSTHLAHLLRESLLDYKEFSSHFQFLSKTIEKVAARQDNDYLGDPA